MPNFTMMLVGILLLLPITTRASAASGWEPRVAIELETEENTHDGCMACGCRAKGTIELGREQAWWSAFGLVQWEAPKGWEALVPASHCGSGSFETVAADFRRTLGMPYVILDLTTTAAVLPAGDAHLTIQLRIQQLSGFDEDRQPVYTHMTQNRTLSFATEGTLTLPLLVPDQRARESFGVHEVLLRLRATVLGREPAASYGILSVAADVPGAEVLLDGGFVGRIAAGKPTLLHNVLVGTREVRVRDLSGREARQAVVVQPNRTVEVGLKVLDLSSAESPPARVPIGKNPQGYEEYWRAKDGAIVVRVPAGEFLMGSPEGVGEAPERPQHQVYVSEFLIDKTEVTWRQFQKFAAAKGIPLSPVPIWGTPDDYPASFIIWEQAQGYCTWVGGRLPTEAEWEKAARGTDGRRYSWGNMWEADRCNSQDGGPHRPESVGSYQHCLSPYGVLDMAGNMWEWCADWYDENYYAKSPPQNPMGPTSGVLRVLRGGSWMNLEEYLRAAFRYKGDPTYRNSSYGFRCVQDVKE